MLPFDTSPGPMHRFIVSLLTTTYTLISCVPAAADAPLFAVDEPLAIELLGPLAATIRDREERNRRPFILRVGSLELDVAVRVRGKSRARVCRFPPLRIYFDTTQTEATPFAGLQSLKVVTHCDNKARAETNVLEEYAAYRVFLDLADIGYLARLARIRYVDTAAERADAERHHAVLLEPRRVMAMRTGADPVDRAGVSMAMLDETQAATVFVYQYLIGNTDWSLVAADDDPHCCHNVDLFAIDERLYPVPYDFDLAGVVDAAYARPDPSLGIGSVTRRRYRGYCMPEAPLRAALGSVRAARDDIVATVASVPGFSDRDIEDIIDYLDKFMAETADEDRVMRRFERRCL